MRFRRSVSFALSLLFMSLAAEAKPAHRHARHHRALASLTLKPPAWDARRARILVPERLPDLQVQDSFYQAHAALVRHDMLRFEIDPPDTNLLGGAVEGPSAISLNSMIEPSRTENLLEVARQADHLLLFRERESNNGSLAVGIGLFGAATALSAHAPPPFRFLFDNNLHLGPALFDAGGMGMGLGGKFL